MAHELALRRSNFQTGPSVRLADGQMWTFPAPPDKIECDAQGFGPEYQAILTAINEAEDLPERRRGELILAIALLGRNYDLRPDQFRQLLNCPSGGEKASQLQLVFGNLASEHLRLARESKAQATAIRQPIRQGRVFEALMRFTRPRRSVDPAALSLKSRTA